VAKIGDDERKGESDRVCNISRQAKRYQPHEEPAMNPSRQNAYQPKPDELASQWAYPGNLRS
jgi:hypothetical protein